tara:strand:- start:122 stop:424 length:303 start_codon:yes stop_codon:yes gene_type:complete
MAIKKDKLPSPDKIKNSNKSFTPEELEEVKKLQTNISDNTFNLGQIMIQKYKIDSQIDLIKNNLFSLEKEEEKLAKKLSSKYGKGHLNLDTGEFISNTNS